MSRVSSTQLLERISLPLSMGGFGLRPVERIRHAAYYASLQQILPEFAKLHRELRTADAFRATQLHSELQLCRAALLEQGAANSFSMAASSSPAAAALAAANALHSATATATSATTAIATIIYPQAAKEAASAHPSPPSSSSSSSSSSPSPPVRPASKLRAKFPSPSKALTQSIDDSWQRAHTGPTVSSALKLQHALTCSVEATLWMRLFNSSSRYQQTILTSLTLNDSTSAWLTTSPTSSEPAYCMRNAAFQLAARHRLGLLPYTELRDELCVGCTARDKETPALLTDPDHAHSCISQKGGSKQRRHDALKTALAGLARSCGYHVEVEPAFPLLPTDRTGSRADESQAHRLTRAGEPDRRRGDLLLLRDNSRLLIDVTVVRPTAPTQLQRLSAVAGAHMQPLVTADAAEQLKHRKYDSECAKHGWKLVPFVLETYGAAGTAARQLLQRMAPHAIDHKPDEFIAHAARVLSVALQVGNAGVAAQATADLYLQQHRRGVAGLSARSSSGPNQRQRHRIAVAEQHQARAAAPHSFAAFAHPGLHSCRVVTVARREQSTAELAAA